MKEIKIRGRICELYRMFYILVYVEEPDKSDSLLKYISHIIFSPFALFSGIMCFYMISIITLYTEQNNKKRIKEILDLKGEIGKLSFCSWSIINITVLGYCLLNYTIITTTVISIIIAIDICSKSPAKLVCVNKHNY